jgi:hypothetical protein
MSSRLYNCYKISPRKQQSHLDGTCGNPSVDKMGAKNSWMRTSEARAERRNITKINTGEIGDKLMLGHYIAMLLHVRHGLTWRCKGDRFVQQ